MKVLLVEDEPSVGQFFLSVLKANRYTVDLADQGRLGLDLATQGSYDVILLDVMLPDLDGISFCQQLRQQGNTTPVLMLTAKTTSQDIVAGLDAGADDYIPKSCDPTQLMARIRAAIRRSEVVPTALQLSWGDLCLDPTLIQVTYQQQPISLSPKEYGLLELLLRHPRRIFSREAIIDALWTIDDLPSNAAVTNLVKDLRRKLRAAGLTAEIIETVHRIGYRLTAAPVAVPPAVADLPPAEQATRAEGLTLLQQAEAAFTASLQPRLQQLSAHLTELQIGAEAEHARLALAQAAHKLAGSLGTFGYITGSELARRLEHLAQGQGPLLPQTLATMVEVMGALQQCIEEKLRVSAARGGERMVPAVPRMDAGTWPQVLAMGLPSDLLEGLQASSPEWELVLIDPVAAGTNGLAAALPQALIWAMPEVEPSSALEKLQDLMAIYPQTPVVVLGTTDSLDLRVAVANAGVWAYVPQSAPIRQILQTVVQAIHHQVPTPATVLVVDDDAAVAQMIAGLLRLQGFEVVSLGDSQQFWQVLQTTRPDLLLLDLEMPGFNGLDLCRVVRQDPDYSHLPILVVTGHTDDRFLQQSFAAGADDFISKPIVAPDLLSRVKRGLQRSRWGSRQLPPDPRTTALALASRPHFDQALTQVWDTHRHQHRQLALIFCALDPPTSDSPTPEIHHQVGAVLLQMVSGARDLVAQYSPQTWAILLPETGFEGALRVIARIQARLAPPPEPWSDPASPALTLSFGVTGTIPQAATTTTDLCTIAQQALEAAQTRGGNTYCLYAL